MYDAFVAQNLSYDCFRYGDHNSIAECDCLACLAAQPDFVPRMCRFRAAQERLQEAEFGEASTKASRNPWKAICDPKCAARLPTKCCNPAEDSVHLENGCPTCLPTRECELILNRSMLLYSISSSETEIHILSISAHSHRTVSRL